LNLMYLMSIIRGSQVKDWNYIDCGDNGRESAKAHPEMAVYLHDVSISLAFGLDCMRDFREPWAKKFPDPHASISYADVLYHRSLVFRTQYVNVDGGRTSLPLPPRTGKFEIPRAYARFIRMLDHFGKMSCFDDYFRRAGMTLSNKTWPHFGRELMRADDEGLLKLVQ
jgi:hypothetical protein